uniref:ORF68 n=1 Tax=Latid herpesvirus 1 TaxID=3096545 RepID=A0AB33V6M6_9VIRU
MSVTVTLEPLVDDMEGRFPIAVHDAPHFVNPRFGYVGGDVNLFSVLDGQERKETQQGGGVHKGGLVHQHEVGDLSSGSLLYMTGKRQEMINTLGPHLDFTDSGVARCIAESCAFQPFRTPWVQLCAAHGTVHMCDREARGACHKLLRIAKLCGIPPRYRESASGGTCLFEKVGAQEEFRTPTAVAVKFAPGTDQKLKEAVLYDGSLSWTPEVSGVQTRLSKYHMLRKSIATGLVPSLIGFLNTVEELKEEEAAAEQPPAKRPLKCSVGEWWENNAHGPITVDLEYVAYEYMELLMSVLYNPNMQPFVTLFKKITEANSDDAVVNSFYLVPLVCAQKLIGKPGGVSQTVIINAFFRKNSFVKQSTFTQFDKVLNKIYDPRDVRPLGACGAWGGELVALLEDMNAHLPE